VSGRREPGATGRRHRTARATRDVAAAGGRPRPAVGEIGTETDGPRAVSLILDTDIGTDVDDALALAMALRHPGIHLRAVTTVSGDPVARARIAGRLLTLGDRTDVEVAAGIGGFSARAWMGHEGKGLPPGAEVPVSSRTAVEVLIEESRTDTPPIVVTIGMQSNVAAAVERDPTWVGRVPLLAVMGGVFAPIPWFGTVLPPSRDHNLVTDAAASVRALNAGFTTLYVPCDVTFRVALRRVHLSHLRAGDDLCRVLAALVDVWAGVMRKRAAAGMPEDVVAFLHDPLTVACAVDRSFVTVERQPVTVALHRGIPRTFVDPLEGVPADVVTDVDADAFIESWLTIVRG
jgi:purine nucleosidase